MMQSQAALDADLFLPEPEAREVWATVISVDDHVVEPPDTFEGRLPAALADRAPRIVETTQGHQVWEFEGERYTQVGMNAVAGRRPETSASSRSASTRCARVLRRRRPGRRHGRQRGLGVGQLPVPDHRVLRSGLLRGRRTRRSARPASGHGTTGSSTTGTVHPDRIIPLGITYLADPERRPPRSVATPPAGSRR